MEGRCDDYARDGLRPSEVLSLRWERIHLNGSGGLLQIAEGKSKAARRMLPMVPAVYDALKVRWNAQGGTLSGWIFPTESKSGHLDRDTAKTERKADSSQTLPTVYHEAYRANSVGRAGCDAFTLARIAGHSSITITQRYCHPQADAIERAFAKLPAGAIATPETARPTAAR